MKIRSVVTATLGRQFSPYLKAVEWERKDSIGDSYPIRLTAIDPILAKNFKSQGPALDVRHMSNTSSNLIVEGIGVFE